MKKSLSQRAFRWISYLLLGFVAFGSFLAAISNAVSLITPFLTYSCTIIIALLWIAAEIYFRKRSVPWIVAATHQIRIQNLGIMPRLAVVGAILLLWFPRVAEFSRSESETRIEEVPIEILADDVVKILVDEEKHARQQYEENKSAEMMKNIAVGFSSDDIILKLFQKYGYEENLSEISKNHHVLITKLVNHLGGSGLVSFVTSEESGRVLKEPPRMSLGFHQESSLEKELELAKSQGQFMAKVSYKEVLLRTDMANRHLLNLLVKSNIETASSISFIEIEDPIASVVRLTRKLSMLQFLENNKDNKDRASQAYALNLLGQIYYGGLLDQSKDYETAKLYFEKSLSASEAINDRPLIRSNCLMLGAMYANGEGVTINEAKSLSYILKSQ